MRVELEEKDALLLSELELSSTDTVLIEQKIMNLSMRQLDRLKLMFVRISEKEDLFTQETMVGIKHNDLKSFTEVVLILARTQMIKHN